MDESISISFSKDGVYETMGLSMTEAAVEDAARRTDESISNERIRKGDRILDTYDVSADAIKGGMGSVWRVHHCGWDIDMAMKRPLPRFFSEGSEQRKENFIRECESWINLALFRLNENFILVDVEKKESISLPIPNEFGIRMYFSQDGRYLIKQKGLWGDKIEFSCFRLSFNY